MTREPLVVDASAFLVLLLDGGREGEWVATRLRGANLTAPQLMPFEVANVIRRQVLAGRITAPQGRSAGQIFADLPVRLWPASLLMERMWELRDNATSYDAAYLALAERLEAPLVTADRRLASVPGISCHVEVVPDLRPVTAP